MTSPILYCCLIRAGSTIGARKAQAYCLGAHPVKGPARLYHYIIILIF